MNINWQANRDARDIFLEQCHTLIYNLAINAHNFAQKATAEQLFQCIHSQQANNALHSSSIMVYGDMTSTKSSLRWPDVPGKETTQRAPVLSAELGWFLVLSYFLSAE